MTENGVLAPTTTTSMQKILDFTNETNVLQGLYSLGAFLCLAKI